MDEFETHTNFAMQSSLRNNTKSQPDSDNVFHRAPDSLSTHFQQMESKCFIQVVDAILKRPAQVIHELIHGTDAKVPLFLMLILIGCLAATGIVMGSFSGGAQIWAVPLKVVAGTLMSGLICLPSLYILLCLCGGKQNFLQTASVLLLSLALASILLIGFIPVAWIFSQATESPSFMGVLYFLIWGIGLFFGLRLMGTALAFLNKREMGALRLWIFIFGMVLLQMSTTLRPLIGKAEPLKLNEKQFFIGHWSNSIGK